VSARRYAAVAVSLLACACASVAGPHSARVTDGRYVMGTVLEITLDGVRAARARQTLEALFAIAERLDGLMTAYDSRSQISRLNRAAGEGPQLVDPDVFDLLQRSRAWSALTGGSFDVTVGPLVELWIDAAVADVPPTAAEIDHARALVGAEKIRLHSDGRVELSRAGVTVDLGGVAKGYALDRMLPVLRERGVGSALIDFGQSSTVAVGAPHDAAGWRLLVRGPSEEVLGVITLSDQALSISSSFGHWLEIRGRRYGHVIDPRTGLPLTRLMQAHIVAPEAGLAEALSKALLILPPEEGIALVAAQAGCEGMLVDADGRVSRTPGWDRATRWAPGVPEELSRADAVVPISRTWRSRT